MNENDLSMEKIYESLASIVSNILRRNAPFYNLPFELRHYKFKYRKYIEYYNEIDESFRDNILKAIIEEAKNYIKRALFEGSEEFKVMSSSSYNTLNDFANWVRKRESTSNSKQIQYLYLSELDDKVREEIIFKNLNSQLAGWEYNKDKHANNSISFEKKLMGRKLIILVDLGIKRTWINFLIGMDNPQFFIDINQLFLVKNSAFEFTNLNEAKTIIPNISKLLKEIMRELEIKITL
jgi:hypothetical protein